MVSKQFAAHKHFANDTSNHLYTYVTSPSPLEFLAKERVIAHGVRLPTHMKINHLQHVFIGSPVEPWHVKGLRNTDHKINVIP